MLSRLMLLSLFFLTLLAGCSHAPPINSGFTDFSAYAESVFRRQNAATTRLMMLNGADLVQDNEQVDDAEEAMADACELLNEYVERESSHESMGFNFKSKVQNSIENCDKQVKQLEELLVPFNSL